MPSIKAVIGSQWGDEGKGLMTDYLAFHNTGYDTNSLVCRHSGGCNAGHTVQTLDGRRHVFGHVAAGSFAAAATHLSKHFIVNPYGYFKELKELEGVNVDTTVYVDVRAKVTSMFDVAINQILEKSRGVDNHGSTGAGINETVTRHLHHERYALTVGDIVSGKCEAILNRIEHEWVPYRLIQLGLTQYIELMEIQSRVVKDWLSIAQSMIKHMTVVDETFLRGKDIIFEGAQGLLLDEINGTFPFVTRSRTGLTNIVDIMNEIDEEVIDVTYMTRAYATRHGPGPFPQFVEGLSYEDPTNVPNPWQGTMRFGSFDGVSVANAIDVDLKKEAGDIHVHPSICITCLDQVNDEERRRVLDSVEEEFKYWPKLGSFGPTRETIKEFS